MSPPLLEARGPSQANDTVALISGTGPAPFQAQRHEQSHQDKFLISFELVLCLLQSGRSSVIDVFRSNFDGWSMAEDHGTNCDDV